MLFFCCCFFRVFFVFLFLFFWLLLCCWYSYCWLLFCFSCVVDSRCHCCCDIVTLAVGALFVLMSMCYWRCLWYFTVISFTFKTIIAAFVLFILLLLSVVFVLCCRLRQCHCYCVADIVIIIWLQLVHCLYYCQCVIEVVCGILLWFSSCGMLYNAVRPFTS